MRCSCYYTSRVVEKYYNNFRYDGFLNHLKKKFSKNIIQLPEKFQTELKSVANDYFFFFKF